MGGRHVAGHVVLVCQLQTDVDPHAVVHALTMEELRELPTDTVEELKVLARESPRQLSEFAVHLCDKAIQFNDECWAAYWYKAAATRQLRDDRDRSGDERWRASRTAGAIAGRQRVIRKGGR